MNQQDQTIRCRIESCVYNSPDHYCTRKTITVAPLSGERPDRVTSMKESCCADFEQAKMDLF